MISTELDKSLLTRYDIYRARLLVSIIVLFLCILYIHRWLSGVCSILAWVLRKLALAAELDTLQSTAVLLVLACAHNPTLHLDRGTVR